jgi:hypothetical protein
VPVLYQYASDKLRGKLGDLAVFERAFGNELYAPLLQHDQLRAEPPTVIGDSARAQLEVRRGGELAVFQVGMVRSRHGDRAGGWTLSGVFREGVDL